MRKKLFTMLSSWDIAVCLHFWARFKMAARGPKRVTSQVFWSFLLPKFWGAKSGPLTHASSVKNQQKVIQTYIIQLIFKEQLPSFSSKEDGLVTQTRNTRNTSSWRDRFSLQIRLCFVGRHSACLGALKLALTWHFCLTFLQLLK